MELNKQGTIIGVNPLYLSLTPLHSQQMENTVLLWFNCVVKYLDSYLFKQ